MLISHSFCLAMTKERKQDYVVVFSSVSASTIGQSIQLCLKSCHVLNNGNMPLPKLLFATYRKLAANLQQTNLFAGRIYSCSQMFAASCDSSANITAICGKFAASSQKLIYLQQHCRKLYHSRWCLQLVRRKLLTLNVDRRNIARNSFIVESICSKFAENFQSKILIAGTSQETLAQQVVFLACLQ